MNQQIIIQSQQRVPILIIFLFYISDLNHDHYYVRPPYLILVEEDGANLARRISVKESKEKANLYNVTKLCLLVYC